jgi:hypothetical protein
MAISIEDFIKRVGAEIVGGKLIIGEMLERRHIGTLYPTTELTDEGKELLALHDKQAADEIIAKGKGSKKAAAPAPISLAEAAANVAAAGDGPATAEGAKE